MIFRQIFKYALMIGIVSGLVLTVVQLWQVIPIIQTAESYETESAVASIGEVHAHDHGTAGGHHHDEGAWAPDDGVERTAFTLLSNVLTAIGLGLVILAAIMFSTKNDEKPKLGLIYGLGWGAAGFSVFYLAPSLGMPPEIPGAAAAPLEMRQMWWLLAVVFTAGGLAGLAFIKSHWRWASIGLLLVPHLVGAPQPTTQHFADKSAAAASELMTLASQFIGATAIANAVFWLVIGMVSVWSVQRIMQRMDQ